VASAIAAAPESVIAAARVNWAAAIARRPQIAVAAN
jgi:hypothetical protein